MRQLAGLDAAELSPAADGFVRGAGEHFGEGAQVAVAKGDVGGLVVDDDAQ
jgi:hypothetical protein